MNPRSTIVSKSREIIKALSVCQQFGGTDPQTAPCRSTRIDGETALRRLKAPSTTGRDLQRFPGGELTRSYRHVARTHRSHPLCHSPTLYADSHSKCPLSSFNASAADPKIRALPHQTSRSLSARLELTMIPAVPTLPFGTTLRCHSRRQDVP